MSSVATPASWDYPPRPPETDVDARDAQGRTPLMYAPAHDATALDLLAAGADPLAEDHHGLVSLEVWALSGRLSHNMTARATRWLDAVRRTATPSRWARALAATSFANATALARALLQETGLDPAQTSAPHGTTVLEWGLVGLAMNAGAGCGHWRRAFPSFAALPHLRSMFLIVQNEPVLAGHPVEPRADEEGLRCLMRACAAAGLPLSARADRLGACLRRGLAPTLAREQAQEVVLDWAFSASSTSSSRTPSSLYKLAQKLLASTSDSPSFTPSEWVAMGLAMRAQMPSALVREEPAWWRETMGRRLVAEWPRLEPHMPTEMAHWMRPRHAAALLDGALDGASPPFVPLRPRL